MTPDDLDRLEALAAAATPGPWRELLGSVYPEGRQPGWEPLPVSETTAIDARWPILAGENQRADAAYIAALDPATVQRLIAAARLVPTLEAELERREDQIARQAASPALEAAFDAVRHDSLDRAWQAAEAALPEGREIAGLTRYYGEAPDDEPLPVLGWRAYSLTSIVGTGARMSEGRGPTPAAALLSLAEALRGRK